MGTSIASTLLDSDAEKLTASYSLDAQTVSSFPGIGLPPQASPSRRKEINSIAFLV